MDDRAASLGRPLFSRLSLLGVGYMGGSLALALRRAGQVAWVVGHDRDPEALRIALERGIVDEIADTPERAVVGADLVVLAAPVRALGLLAEAIAPHLPPSALVVDLGSVKGPVAERIIAALGSARFVACHPLAGLEKTGVAAADAALYSGRPCVVCPLPGVEPCALERVEALWRAAGAEVTPMALAAHDPWVAALSHLPHAVAFALAATVAVDGARLRGLLPGGTLTSSLRDTTRVAASGPEVWRDIFLMNRSHVLPLLARFTTELSTLAALIENEDESALLDWLARARAGRNLLFGD